MSATTANLSFNGFDHRATGLSLFVPAGFPVCRPAGCFSIPAARPDHGIFFSLKCSPAERVKFLLTRIGEFAVSVVSAMCGIVKARRPKPRFATVRRRSERPQKSYLSFCVFRV